MPTYSKPQRHKDMGNITITPKPLWRRVFKFVPYYVGDTVNFSLHIDNPSKAWRLYERFGDDVLPIKTVLGKDMDIAGRVINDEGNIEYRLGVDPSLREGVTLMTAKAWHKDTFVAQWFWLAVGAAITLACVILGAILSLLSGLIQINPEWIFFFR